MERTLLWSALALGGLGWLCACLFARTQRPSEGTALILPRPYRILAIAIPLLVFLGSLPSRPPFAPGQGLGRGFLLGALLAGLSGLALRLPFGQREGSAAGTAVEASGPMFLGVVAVTIPLIAMRATLPDALLGVAIGHFVISFLLLCAWIGQGDEGRRATLQQAAGAGFTATLAASVALAEMRGAVRFTAAPLPVAWSAIGVVFAVCVPLAALLGALLAAPLARAATRLPGAGRLARLTEPFAQGHDATQAMARLIPAAGLLLAAARLFQSRLEARPPLWGLTLLGLGAGLICWWLTAEAHDARASAARTARGLGALLMLCTLMAAYQEFAGFGVGWMLLAAWLVVIGAPGDAAPSRMEGTDRLSRLLSLLLFGSVILLYRLFAMRYRHSLQGIEITDHSVLFGLLLGALVPPLLSSLLLARPAGSRAVGAGRLLTLGAVTLFIPTTLLILFGAKCAPALFFGLAVAATFSSSESDPERTALESLLPGLFALAIALALTQWTHALLPLVLYARAARVRALGMITAALIALFLAADYGDRLQRRREARREADALRSPKGAAR